MSQKINAVLLNFEDKSNSNGRLYYSKEAIVEAVKNFNEDKNNKRLGKITKEGDIELEPVGLTHVSHKIDRLEFEGEKLVCDAEILDTPDGKIIQELLKAGTPPKLSPRMEGEPVYEIDENGNQTNKVIGYKNIHIISVDII